MKVGQRVIVPFPGGNIPAIVVEDRGMIGVGGRQIVSVHTLEEMEEARSTFEVPAEYLELVE